MARIPLLDENDPSVPDDARALLDGLKQKHGVVMNVYRAMANSPDSAEAFRDLLFAAYLDYKSLQPKQVELAFFTASVLNKCHYCIPTHTVLGRSVGLTEAQMQHLGDDPLPPGVYDAAEAAIVRFSQKSTRLEPIDDATYAELVEHFTTRQLVDLSLAVGLSNMVNRFAATFRLDVDERTIAMLDVKAVIV